MTNKLREDIKLNIICAFRCGYFYAKGAPNCSVAEIASMEKTAVNLAEEYVKDFKEFASVSEIAGEIKS